MHKLIPFFEPEKSGTRYGMATFAYTPSEQVNTDYYPRVEFALDETNPASFDSIEAPGGLTFIRPALEMVDPANNRMAWSNDPSVHRVVVIVTDGDFTVANSQYLYPSEPNNEGLLPRYRNLTSRALELYAEDLAAGKVTIMGLGTEGTNFESLKPRLISTLGGDDGWQDHSNQDDSDFMLDIVKSVCSTTQCDSAQHSEKTCGDLGANHFASKASSDVWKFNSVATTVCAASSASPNHDCQGKVTFDQAEEICATSGARLCSKCEIEDGVTAAAGCSLDYRHLWTSTQTRDGNYQYVVKGDGSDTKIATDRTYHVRCCADQPPAQKSCAALPATFKTTAEKNVCGASIIADTDGSEYCYAGTSPTWCRSRDGNGDCVDSVPNRGQVTWAEASWTCKVAGARLCSLEELSDNIAKGTGCGADKGMVWTDTRGDCPYGQHVSARGSGDSQARCYNSHWKQAVRCCSDVVQLTPAATSQDSCADIRSSGVSKPEYRDPAKEVCAFSGVSGQCLKKATIAEAIKYCEGAGARLCSATELDNGLAKGTKCGHDGRLVWSSTPCDGMNSFIAVQGNGDSASRGCYSHQNFAARCCADTASADAELGLLAAEDVTSNEDDSSSKQYTSVIAALVICIVVVFATLAVLVHRKRLIESKMKSNSVTTME